MWRRPSPVILRCKRSFTARGDANGSNPVAASDPDGPGPEIRFRSGGRRHHIAEDRLKKFETYHDNPFPDAVVHVTSPMSNTGGSRQYWLLPPNVELLEALRDPKLGIASLYRHDNVVFGPRLLPGHAQALEEDDEEAVVSLTTVCPPLVEAAVRDIEQQSGMQPQALSALYGLCSWVVQCLENNNSSAVLQQLAAGKPILEEPPLQRLGPDGEIQSIDPPQPPAVEDDDTAAATTQLEAVRAIATGTPRPGHSVLGKGTFHVGQAAWKALGREFVQQQPPDECQLYLAAGAELVEVEHLADTKPRYIANAGGAMGRFYFL